MRTVQVTREEGHWWDLPWCACLYEDGLVRACACAFTREGAIRSLKRKITYLDRPRPQIVHEEEFPLGPADMDRKIHE